MQKPDNPLRFTDRQGWRQWLAEHHTSEKDAWLALEKGRSKDIVFTLPEAIEEALCFGWVDSILMKLDEKEYALRFTPRKLGSNWSQSNRERAERLIAEGRMAEAGLAAVQAAKAEGGWERLRKFDINTDIPPELSAQFEQDPGFRAHFMALRPSMQQAFLNWLNQVKSSEARARRAAKLVDMVAENLANTGRAVEDHGDQH